MFTMVILAIIAQKKSPDDFPNHSLTFLSQDLQFFCPLAFDLSLNDQIQELVSFRMLRIVSKIYQLSDLNVVLMFPESL